VVTLFSICHFIAGVALLYAWLGTRRLMGVAHSPVHEDGSRVRLYQHFSVIVPWALVVSTTLLSCVIICEAQGAAQHAICVAMTFA
jgi:hypothetical protein